MKNWRKDGGFTLAEKTFRIRDVEIRTSLVDHNEVPYADHGGAYRLGYPYIEALINGQLPYGMPRIKVAGTSSYALFAGGISAILLGLVYWIVDVRGLEYEKAFFFGGFLKAFPGPVMNCIAEWGTVGLFWLLLYWMYRREIFLKV